MRTRQRGAFPYLLLVIVRSWVVRVIVRQSIVVVRVRMLMMNSRRGSMSGLLLGFLGLLLRKPSCLDGLSTSVILGLLLFESFLVFVSEVFVLLSLLGGQGPPSFAHDCAQIDEFDIRKLLHDLRTHHLSEEDIRALGTLGSVRVTILLPASLVLEGFEEISGRIVPRWRHIGRHLGIVPHFVLTKEKGVK